MKRTHKILAGLLLCGMFLVSCSMPATTPAIQATKTGNAPFPVVTSAQIVHDVVSQTQTAEALTGGSQATNALPTMGPTNTLSSGGVATATGGITFATTTVPTAQATHKPFATSTPGRPLSVVVQKGETCYCLARRYNVNPVDLTSANSACTGTLDPGTTITIPQSGSFPAERALKPHPTNYTVTYGETIYSIACDFGDADPNLIIAANGLVSPFTLSGGQVLYIP